MNHRLVLLLLTVLVITPGYALSQAVSPIPSNTDTAITVSTGAAKAGSSITIKTSKVAGDCAAKGTVIPLAEDAGTSKVVLNGQKTIVTIKPGLLAVGDYLCAVMTGTKSVTAKPAQPVAVGQPPAKPVTTTIKVTVNTPEVTVKAPPLPVLPTIVPVPTSADTMIILSTAPAVAGDKIVIKKYSVAGSCASAVTVIPLVTDNGTGDSVLNVPKTMVTVAAGALTAGDYLCAELLDATTKAIKAITPEVVIGKASAAPVASVAAAPVVPSISPVPTSSDTSVTITTAPAKKDDIITLNTATTAESCAASKTTIALVDDQGTGKTVIDAPKTTVTIKAGALTEGNYLCAVISDPKTNAPTATTPAVAVGKAVTIVKASPAISPAPAGNDSSITLNTANATVGQIITIQKDTNKVDPTKPSVSCDKLTSPLDLDETGGVAQVKDGGTTKVHLQNPLASGDRICAVISDSKSKAVSATTPEVTVNSGCKNPGTYSDCTFEYLLIGGIEQSDLSAQNSVTDGFYDLFLRRPVDNAFGSFWFRSRYLGTPSSTSKQNVVAAASDPTGTLTSADLPQSVTAVDYTLGYQFDKWVNGKRRTTFSPIVGFGATSPLGASSAVSGFTVPLYGTNECTQLQLRFGAGNKYGYNPVLPASGPLTPNYGIGTPPANLCSVQPNPQSTAANPLAGTQITTIAFTNEDRSSFLLKWGAGVRIIDRPLSGSSGCATTTGCSRLIADFTLGQDQAITGGTMNMKKLVLKADAIIPVFSTGAYFFASSANRLSRNTVLSPLILSPVTIASSTSSTTCATSTTTVCFPSNSVFVLPYKQQDRDDYRIGIGIDVAKIFKKLFNPAATTTANQ
jgi:hypothetical protein